MPPEIFQLTAGHKGHGFDGVIFRDDETEEEVWECVHAHETVEDADKCARERLGSLADQLIPEASGD